MSVRRVPAGVVMTLQPTAHPTHLMHPIHLHPTHLMHLHPMHLMHLHPTHLTHPSHLTHRGLMR